METQIAFGEKIEAAMSLITYVNSLTVTTRQEHEAAGHSVSKIRDLEKALEAGYSEHPVIVEAKRLQGIKGALSKDLESARKAGKAAMIKYEEVIEAEGVQAEQEAQRAAKALAEQAALEAALQAEQEGDKATAEAIIQEPVVPAVIVVPQEKLKAPGHTRRRVYKARIIDPSLVPDEYWTLDTSKIDATIRARKEEGQNVIPGVLAYSEVV